MTAQGLLIERRDMAVASFLGKLVREGETSRGRLLALYALEGIGILEPREVAVALHDPSYIVRTHALQLADRWLQTDKWLTAQVVNMTSDPDYRVRLQLAMSLGEADGSTATETLLKLVRQYGNDRWMAAAVLSSTVETAGTLLQQILADVQLRQQSKRLLRPLATTVAAGNNSDSVAHAIDKLVGLEDGIRVPCLEGFVEGLSQAKQPIESPAEGWASVKRLLLSPSDIVRSQGFRLGTLLDLQELPEMRAIFETAGQRILNGDLTVEQRQQAVELLKYAPYATIAPVSKILLDVQQPTAMQLSAVRLLAESDEPEIGSVLLAGWKSYGPQLRAAVLDVLMGREHHLSVLLDAVEQGTIHLENINASRRELFTGSRIQHIKARAEELFGRRQRNAEFQTRVERYRAALNSPQDPQLGREVFEKHCLDCHKLGNKGYQVGPNLGGAINKPDESILIEILDPSGDIAAGFGTYVIFTKDGRIFNGILSSDSSTSVSLHRAKGAVDTILRRDIETMVSSEISLMPSDLHAVVSPQDIANLISFLRQEFGENK